MTRVLASDWMIFNVVMLLQVVRVGSKKTAFANFNEIAKMLHR